MHIRRRDDCGACISQSSHFVSASSAASFNMAFKFAWSREADASYPRTWATFKAKSGNSNELVEFVVCDLTPDRFNEAFALLRDDFLIEEPMTSSIGLGKVAAAVDSFRLICQSSLDQRVALACYDTSTNTLVGANIVFIIGKEDEMTKQWKELVCNASRLKCTPIPNRHRSKTC